MSLRLVPAIVLAVLAAAPAFAQQPQPLRIDRPTAAPASGVTGAASAEQPEGRAAAILQNRLAGLEEEVRRLTGRLEEAEHRDAETRARIDRLVADLDRRLAALELAQESAADPSRAGSDALPAALVAAGAGGAAAPAGGAAGGGAAGGGAATEDPAARAGHVLGTIPRDALLGIPAPDAARPAGSAPAAALQGSAEARFTAALDLLQTGDWAAAEVAFSRWLEDFPDDRQAPVAAYWIGESQLARDDHATAAATFAANYRRFGADSARAADNLLKLGTALAAMGDTTRACQTFTEMGRRYPDASAALLQALERERRAARCG